MNNLEKAITHYQCAGCVNGPALSCYEKHSVGSGCGKHMAGTFLHPGGHVFPGMPKGFCRLGPIGFAQQPTTLVIFKSWAEANDFYDKWNIPVWKYLNEKSGHTFVRGMHPRNNMPFLHVYMENVIDKINCFTVDQDMIDFMD